MPSSSFYTAAVGYETSEQTLDLVWDKSLDPKPALSRLRPAADRRQYDIVTGEYAEQQPGDFGCALPPMKADRERSAGLHSSSTHVGGSARTGGTHAPGSTEAGAGVPENPVAQIRVVDTSSGDSVLSREVLASLINSTSASGSAAASGSGPVSASSPATDSGSATGSVRRISEARGSTAAAAGSSISAADMALSTGAAAMQQGSRCAVESRAQDESMRQGVAARFPVDAPPSPSKVGLPAVQPVVGSRARRGSGATVGEIDGDDTGRFNNMGTGVPARDLRLDPVQNIAKWIAFFGDTDGD